MLCLMFLWVNPTCINASLWLYLIVVVSCCELVIMFSIFGAGGVDAIHSAVCSVVVNLFAAGVVVFIVVVGRSCMFSCYLKLLQTCRTINNCSCKRIHEHAACIANRLSCALVTRPSVSVQPSPMHACLPALFICSILSYGAFIDWYNNILHGNTWRFFLITLALLQFCKFVYNKFQLHRTSCGEFQQLYTISCKICNCYQKYNYFDYILPYYISIAK